MAVVANAATGLNLQSYACFSSVRDAPSNNPIAREDESGTLPHALTIGGPEV